MLSKSQISFVNALHHKKYRIEHNLFIVEGIKSVTEFLQSDYRVDTVFCTPQVLPKINKLSQIIKQIEISETDLSKISSLNAPQGILALVNIPEPFQIKAEDFTGFTLVLDGIQDPGNLGTIIRTCDWFGFKNLICSENSVEVYNQKVVQATMGSLSRVSVFYTSLDLFLKESKKPVFGALLEGESVYNTTFNGEGFILLGNEGRGISDNIRDKINYPVTIPGSGSAESLNVAVCAALFCYEIKRNC